MLWDELKRLKRSPRELRRFGLWVGLVLALLGAWMHYRGKPAGPYVWGTGAALVALGWLAPRWLLQVYVVWMTIGLTLGGIVSTVLLTLFYYLAVTPLGLLARLVGKDFLSLKLNRHAATYWIPKQPSALPDAVEAERQF